jgi:hypothetical protein
MPQITAAGRALQARVAGAWSKVEGSVLAGLSARDQRALRLMLCHLIDAGPSTRIAGSCV